MRKFSIKLMAGLAGFAMTAGAGHANVSADQAARLGKDLTPMGSEKAGNADGSIPAWEGGITTPPAGYKVGDWHPDPFKGEKPTLQITPANYQQYAEKLAPGTQAMFAKYPTFRMDVYPTHRTASFPARTYEYTAKNATACKLVADGDGIENCAEGFPFPIPQNAYEVIWNHKLKYKGLSVQSYSNQAAPTATGAYHADPACARKSSSASTIASRCDHVRQRSTTSCSISSRKWSSPARLAGNVLLVHETLNASANAAPGMDLQPWTASRPACAERGLRQSRHRDSDGLRTNDMTDMFNGAMDRFDWKLVGKKEMLRSLQLLQVAHSGRQREAEGSGQAPATSESRITCATSCTASGWLMPRSRKACPPHQQPPHVLSR